MDIFREKYLTREAGRLIRATDVLENKFAIILLFASSKCSEIDKLIEQLREVHEESMKFRCGFEIVLISLDENAQGYNDLMAKTKNLWFALPYEHDRSGSFVQQFIWRFEISHIPFIIVVKPDGTYISRDGIKELEELGINVIIAWTD